MRNESIQDKLVIFHKSFNHPVDADYPRPSSIINKDKQLRKLLVEEEYKELIHAIQSKKADEVLKELCDLVYVCVGFATTFGWDFDTAFNRVHASNLSKLDSEGNPLYREDGKVIKSDCYKPPILKDCV
jgi:phosphoribosyl-ATP pyrophosphohydrolase